MGWPLWIRYLPVPEWGMERESMFPYWLLAPFPGGGVTLKNLGEEKGVALEARTQDSGWGFPGGSVDREYACQCRKHWFDPRSWKIPQAAEQLSL